MHAFILFFDSRMDISIRVIFSFLFAETSFGVPSILLCSRGPELLPKSDPAACRPLPAAELLLPTAAALTPSNRRPWQLLPCAPLSRSDVVCVGAADPREWGSSAATLPAPLGWWPRRTPPRMDSGPDCGVTHLARIRKSSSSPVPYGAADPSNGGAWWLPGPLSGDVLVIPCSDVVVLLSGAADPSGRQLMVARGGFPVLPPGRRRQRTSWIQRQPSHGGCRTRADLEPCQQPRALCLCVRACRTCVEEPAAHRLAWPVRPPHWYDLDG